MSDKHTHRIPWRRFIGETTLIVVSVFVAIALESLWQEHQQAAEARDALAQVLLELRQDRMELDSVIARQSEMDEMYTELDTMMGEPDSIAAARFTELLDDMTYDNKTLFARRSAWTMMVESGYLPLLDDAELVGHMAKFYEDMTARLDFNNENYDDELFTIMRETRSQVWDSSNNRFRTSTVEDIGRFRDELRYLHLVWNLWYLNFMQEYSAASDALMADIESYIQEY